MKKGIGSVEMFVVAVVAAVGLLTVGIASYDGAGNVVGQAAGEYATEGNITIVHGNPGLALRDSFLATQPWSVHTAQDKFHISKGYGHNPQLLTILNDGNVGIGTNAPQEELDIHGPHSQLRLTDSDTGEFTQLSYSSDMLAFRNNDPAMAPILALKDDGKVGIGTSNPKNKLDVHDGSGWFHTVGGARQTNIQLGHKENDASPLYDIITNDIGEDLLEIRSRRWGNKIMFTRGSNDGDQNVALLRGSDGGHRIDLFDRTSNTVDVRLSDSSASYIRDGDFGIRTNSPSATLDVVGTVEIDGPNGGCLKIKDVEGGGWTYCQTQEGEFFCSTTAC